jgi:hypothetical protein
VAAYVNASERREKSTATEGLEEPMGPAMPRTNRESR